MGIAWVSQKRVMAIIQLLINNRVKKINLKNRLKNRFNMKGISVSEHKFSGFFYFILLLAALFPLAPHAHPGHNATMSGSTGHGMSMNRQMGKNALNTHLITALLGSVILDGDNRVSRRRNSAQSGRGTAKLSKRNGTAPPPGSRGGKKGNRGLKRNGNASNSSKPSVRQNSGKGNDSIPVKGKAPAYSKVLQEQGNNGQPSYFTKSHSETPGPGETNPGAGTGRKRANKKTKMSDRQQADSRVPAASPYSVTPSRRSKRQSGTSAPVCVDERNFIRELKKNPNGHFIQTTDIDMEKAEKHAGLYSIRHPGSPAEGLPEFRGTYNGGGYRLHHVYSKPALFSRLNRAVIKHVDLINDEGPGRGQAFGLEAGLLAGESVDSTFMDVSLNEAEINRGSLTQQGLAEDAKPRSGGLVGRSDNSVYVDIRAAGFDVGNDGYPVSGTLIGSGDNNRFSNIYLDDFKVKGASIGSIVGRGNNNTIVDFFIDSSGEGNPSQLVGSGNDTSIRRGVVTGQLPPYYPAGTTVEEVIGHFRLSDSCNRQYRYAQREQLAS